MMSDPGTNAGIARQAGLNLPVRLQGYDLQRDFLKLGVGPISTTGRKGNSQPGQSTLHASRFGQLCGVLTVTFRKKA